MDMAFLLHRGYWEAKMRQPIGKHVRGNKMNKLACLPFSLNVETWYSLTGLSQARCIVPKCWYAWRAYSSFQKKAFFFFFIVKS